MPSTLRAVVVDLVSTFPAGRLSRRFRFSGLVSLVACIAVVPGCLESPMADPASGEASSLVTDSPPSVSFERCVGTFATIPVSMDEAGKLLPDAFEFGRPGLGTPLVVVPLPLATTELIFQPLSCPEARIGNDNVGPAQYLVVSLRAHAKDESWGTDGVTEFFLLDFLVSDARLAAALNEAGARARVGRFSEDSSENLARWTFETDTSKVDLSFGRMAGKPEASGRSPFEIWFDHGGEFRKFELEAEYARDDPLVGPAEISIQGSEAWVTGLTGCCKAGDSWPYAVYSSTWTANATVFR